MEMKENRIIPRAISFVKQCTGKGNRLDAWADWVDHETERKVMN